MYFVVLSPDQLIIARVTGYAVLEVLIYPRRDLAALVLDLWYGKSGYAHMVDFRKRRSQNQDLKGNTTI